MRGAAGLARQNAPAAVYGRLRVVILGVVGKVGLAPSPCHGRRAVPVGCPPSVLSERCTDENVGLPRDGTGL